MKQASLPKIGSLRQLTAPHHVMLCRQLLGNLRVICNNIKLVLADVVSELCLYCRTQM